MRSLHPLGTLQPSGIVPRGNSSCGREWPRTRRDFLRLAGGGFGGLALTAMLQEGAGAKSDGNFPAPPPRLPTARSVIFLFMEGGPSHIDLFDPKPTLNTLAGQKLPASFGPIITAMGEVSAPLMASPRKWRQYGQSGLWISEWLPNIAQHADDLCVIRSCWADGLNHVGSVCQMNTGSVDAGRPSLGSWVQYGLGSENQNLPAFCVLLDNNKLPLGGRRNWGTGFMPAAFQGTQFVDGDEPIPHLGLPRDMTASRQAQKQQLLRRLNDQHRQRFAAADDLDARIQSFELAFRMQQVAPEAVDLSQETSDTLKLYGMDADATRSTGRVCLLARRLVERGVRFVQVYCGTGSGWDAHSKLEENHGRRCRAMDRPVAGLLHDLQQRGLLDETLIVWGGEFGRTPMSEQGDGRDHNPFGFTMWMAGGGVHGGQNVGATDEVGLRAVEQRAHVHDLHATILHAMGLDHLDLSYLHQGRRENPTINQGDVIPGVFS